jgi:3'(2'), 5'-bisphosphate nucleotidase
MTATPAGIPPAPTPENLAHLVSLVRAAGRATLQFYGRAVPVEHKADASPVTTADRVAHELLSEALRAWDPTIPIISEEGDIPPIEERRDWRRFWLVDPLDGTKEFLQGNGEFTVNVALIDGGRPVLGAISAPALDVLYFAGDGLGAWKREGGRAAVRLLSRNPRPGEPVRVIESRSHPSPELEEFLRALPISGRVKAGSSLKFCRVAEGNADVYPRLGPTMEWDVAAGDCIFRNSGEHGPRYSPLVYNRPDLRIPSFVIGFDQPDGRQGG